MKLKQLSLFLENKPGNVCSACRLLADAGINIETMALADTEQFGILRLLLKHWDQALDVFDKHGVVVKVTEVVAVLVDDRPGGLADILGMIDSAGINIEYMYGFGSNQHGKAVIVFRFDNTNAAIDYLLARGVQIIGSQEIFANEK